MAELKWYDILEVLFGTILSIADPITDMLTLREFYRAGHKTWFGVGVTSIIFPTLFFLFGNFNIETDRDRGQWTAWECTRILVLGRNPLLPAWLKLRTLISYLKNSGKVVTPIKRVKTWILSYERDANSLFWPRPLLNQLLSSLFSCTPWLFNRGSTAICEDRSNGFPTCVFP